MEMELSKDEKESLDSQSSVVMPNTTVKCAAVIYAVFFCLSFESGLG